MEPLDIVNQIKILVEKDYKEIVLTGVDLTSYGDDLNKKTNLAQLIALILKSVPNLNRLRLSSLDVAEIDNDILKLLNGKRHYLISSVCISKGGSMIWNYTDKAKLWMKKFNLNELENYLSKISDEALYAYNVYQIEGEGKTLFSKINEDEDTIMGLPVKQIKEYLNQLK